VSKHIPKKTDAPENATPLARKKRTKFSNKYDPDLVAAKDLNSTPNKRKLILKLCELGAPILEIADTLGVTSATINAWLREDSGFHKAFEDARLTGDKLRVAAVEDALFMRALGMTVYAEVMTKTGQVMELKKELAPDVAACQYILSTQKSEKWQQKTYVNLEGNVGIEVVRYQLPDNLRQLENVSEVDNESEVENEVEAKRKRA